MIMKSLGWIFGRLKTQSCQEIEDEELMASLKDDLIEVARQVELMMNACNPVNQASNELVIQKPIWDRCSEEADLEEATVSRNSVFFDCCQTSDFHRFV